MNDRHISQGTFIKLTYTITYTGIRTIRYDMHSCPPIDLHINTRERIHTQTCVNIHRHTHARVLRHTHSHTHTRARAHTHTHTCSYARVRTRKSLCLCLSVCLCLSLCLSLCPYTGPAKMSRNNYLHATNGPDNTEARNVDLPCHCSWLHHDRQSVTLEGFRLISD